MNMETTESATPVDRIVRCGGFEGINVTEVIHYPVLCRVSRPMDQRVLGWCDDEKVWKCGHFMEASGVQWFKHEGQGPIYGEHEVSHWMPMPDAPR